MKKCIFLVLVVLSLASCVRDDGGAALRGNFVTLDEFGLCEGDRMTLSFDRESYQYWCSPDKGLYRFTDHEGDEYMTLTLSGIPSGDSKVSGSVSDNLGRGSLELPDLYILKQTGYTVWLWSDAARCGVVLPAWGLINR